MWDCCERFKSIVKKTQESSRSHSYSKVLFSCFLSLYIPCCLFLLFVSQTRMQLIIFSCLLRISEEVTFQHFQMNCPDYNSGHQICIEQTGAHFSLLQGAFGSSEFYPFAKHPHTYTHTTLQHSPKKSFFKRKKTSNICAVYCWIGETLFNLRPVSFFFVLWQELLRGVVMICVS